MGALSVWAFATVGFGYNSAKGANAIDSIHVRSEDYDGDREMIFDTLEVVDRLLEFSVYSADLGSIRWASALRVRLDLLEALTKILVGGQSFAIRSLDLILRRSIV